MPHPESIYAGAPLQHMRYVLVRVHGCQRNPHLAITIYHDGDDWVAWTFNRQTGGHSLGVYGDQAAALRGFDEKVKLYD